MIVLSDADGQSSSNLNGGSSLGQAQHDNVPLSRQGQATNMQTEDGVLDNMLEQQFPGMFDLAALQAAVPHTDESHKVTANCRWITVQHGLWSALRSVVQLTYVKVCICNVHYSGMRPKSTSFDAAGSSLDCIVPQWQPCITT